MKELIAHLKQSGFVFQGSEIYGGLANTWDYGPLGVLLAKNIKNLWWKEFVTKNNNIYGLDSKILMNPNVWKASGHLGNFSDPLIENKTNGKRYRADELINQFDQTINTESWTNQKMHEFITKNITKYENQKADWTEIREFHLMFETNQGVIVGKKSLVYLRPETAQGIFINFKNIQRSQRSKIPFGIAQIGKSFRNEVTPGNFIFRTREFEQMELEYFVKPGLEKVAYQFYVDKSFEFIKKLGINPKNLKLRIHQKDELAHYSNGTSDIEYNFAFGWGEIAGIASRTDFDLKAHIDASKQDLKYLDPITNEKYIPYVIEPSFGVDRLMLTVLSDAYNVEKITEKDSRIVLKINKELAPYKVAILPLMKKLSKGALEIFEKIVDNNISAIYDQTGSIGKRYRRQDSIGTPYCVTFDFDSLEDGKVTIRERDTMKQTRIDIEKISLYIIDKLLA